MRRTQNRVRNIKIRNRPGHITFWGVPEGQFAKKSTFFRFFWKKIEFFVNIYAVLWLYDGEEPIAALIWPFCTFFDPKNAIFDQKYPFLTIFLQFWTKIFYFQEKNRLFWHFLCCWEVLWWKRTNSRIYFTLFQMFLPHKMQFWTKNTHSALKNGLRKDFSKKIWPKNGQNWAFLTDFWSSCSRTGPLVLFNHRA